MTVDRNDREDLSNDPPPLERLSARYGVPKETFDALLRGSELDLKNAHPLTMAALEQTAGHQSNNRMNNRQTTWSPVAVLGVILGVVGILSLAVLFAFIMRMNQPQPPVIPVQEAPTAAAPMPVPAPIPDTLTAEHQPEEIIPVEPKEMPPPTAAKPKSKPKPKIYLHTSDGLEAQEKLAELRSEGNKKAKIITSEKNGVTFYTVR
jgi:outer membrane biosynthesis protein TonB